jgi:hypothetical protein
MAVYVDALKPAPRSERWRWPVSSHLFADTLDELHHFARRLDLMPQWFQPDGGRLPHYDLNRRRHAAAIKAGAILVGLDQVKEHIRRNREALKPEPAQ